MSPKCRMTDAYMLDYEASMFQEPFVSWKMKRVLHTILYYNKEIILGQYNSIFLPFPFNKGYVFNC